MQNEINELYEKLVYEYDVLYKILKIEEEKNAYLVQGKLKDFSEMNENLEKLVENSSKAERERTVITEKIMDSYGLEKNASLNELIPNLKSESQSKFKKIYEDFKDILTAIKLYSNTNSEMLKNTLDILDITLANLTQDYEIEYGDDEKKAKSRSKKSVLLNKLA